MSAAVSQLGALLDALQNRVAELEKRAGLPVGASAPAGAAAASSGSSSSSADVDQEPTGVTKEFDGLVAKFGTELENVGKTIGGDVDKLASTFAALWRENRKMIHLATKCKKPAAEELKKLRQGVLDTAKPIFDLKGSRDCKAPNAAAGAADACPAFAWVNMEGGPLETITAAIEGCDFFLNKVRKQSKDENQPHLMTFANLIRDGLKALHDYVKENFKMGLSWNGKGADVSAFLGGAAATPASPASPAPAASAAGAGAVAAAPPKVPTPAGGNDPAKLQSALFAQLQSIDQSSGRTAGLKHVTKDMKSKPGDAPAVVPAAAAAATKTPTASATATRREDAIPTGTPRTELVDKRCYVEFHQTKGSTVTLPQAEGQGTVTALNMTQEVYCYGCKDIAVIVNSKVKAVRLDKCSNVTVLVESVLSGIEVVNSKRIKMQVKQMCPSVAIDKTDGIVVGLAWPCRDAQIVTSKSSEMNVTFPVSEAEDADWVELPIPEQFVTKIGKDGKLSSSVSELYTH